MIGQRLRGKEIVNSMLLPISAPTYSVVFYMMPIHMQEYVIAIYLYIAVCSIFTKMNF